jgi:DNA modification methylase
MALPFCPQRHFARKGIGPDKIVATNNAGQPGKSSKKHAQGETYGHGGWTASTEAVAALKTPDSVVAQSVPGGFREKDPGAKAAQLHPARFPVELPAFHMRAYKELLPAGPWVDPFAGSFSTLLAGEREGVKTYMIEENPRYFAAALERCELEGLGPTRMYDNVGTARRASEGFANLFR